MTRSIAFFDFDGTITRKDTMLEFIRYAKGPAAYYAGLLLISPWLSGLKIGLIPAAVAKEKMLARFFKGMPLSEFDKLCEGFSRDVVPGLIRPDALEEINLHKSNGVEIVVVSASAENWICYWCREMDLAYIGTKLITDDKGRITGKISGSNCNGAEKVNRIKLSYDPASYSDIFCYGDSKGDLDMLNIANHPFYRKFIR